jgi:hypothetical protein
VKVAPVSADLLIKLAVAALLVGGAVWAVRSVKRSITGVADDVLNAANAAVDSVKNAAASAFDTAKVAANAVNPANPDNLLTRSPLTMASGWDKPTEFFKPLDSDRWAGGG